MGNWLWGGDGYITLYHYTSVESARMIGQQKLILASDPEVRDAVYGKGVYLTSYGPELGKQKLKNNNWGGRPKIKKKLEAYVQIKMPENDPNLEDVSEGGRNIFLYTGNIDLDDYSYTISKF